MYSTIPGKLRLARPVGSHKYDRTANRANAPELPRCPMGPPNMGSWDRWVALRWVQSHNDHSARWDPLPANQRPVDSSEHELMRPRSWFEPATLILSNQQVTKLCGVFLDACLHDYASNWLLQTSCANLLCVLANSWQLTSSRLDGQGSVAPAFSEHAVNAKVLKLLAPNWSTQLEAWGVFDRIWCMQRKSKKICMCIPCGM